MLQDICPGLGRSVSARVAFLPNIVHLTLTADAPMPVRFTTDGRGVSAQFEWSGVKPETAALVFLVEDADAPLPRPLLRLVLHRMQGSGPGASPTKACRPAAARSNAGYGPRRYA